MPPIDVTVYGKPNCVQCDQTERHLKKLGIDYTKVDITQDAEAYNFARSLDETYLAAPIVTVVTEKGELLHWNQYRHSHLEALKAVIDDADSEN